MKIVNVDKMIKSIFFRDAFEARAKIGIDVLTYFQYFMMK